MNIYVIYKLNQYIVINTFNYNLWNYNLVDFKKFTVKYFDKFDSSN